MITWFFCFCDSMYIIPLHHIDGCSSTKYYLIKITFWAHRRQERSRKRHCHRPEWVSTKDMEYTGHRPAADLLLTRHHFPQSLDLCQGLKIGVPCGCLRETLIFKIIMIDDVTLWSTVKSSNLYGMSTRFY